MSNSNNKKLRRMSACTIKSAIKINSNFCFSIYSYDVNIVSKAIEYYKNNKKEIQEVLNSNVPIAIDTNIILDLYRISIKEKDTFVEFLNRNYQRILIPAQVQEEYLKHRIPQINKTQKAIRNLCIEFDGITDNIVNFKSKSESKFSQFKNKALVKDMPYLTEKLSEAISSLADGYPSEYMDKIKNKVDEIKETLKEGITYSLEKSLSETKDNVLDAVARALLLPRRTEEERYYIYNLYHDLLDEYQKHKENKEEKRLYTFPCSGDSEKEKYELDPCGDFYIYHELLAYMKENNTDVYLLTNDTTKDDWVDSDKLPFFHYIVDVYRNTGHMLYFLNAKDFTTMSFAPLTDSGEDEDSYEESQETKLKEASDDNLQTASSPDDEKPLNSEESTKEEKGSFYRDITEERMIAYLKYSLEWRKKFKGGYVSKEDFIRGYLGHKRYYYSSSYRMLDKLVEEGKIECYKEEHNGKSIDCLRLKDE